MKLIGLITIYFCLIASTSTEYVFTKRANNYLREGPGAFYQLVSILPVNKKLEIIEKETYWLKVQTDDNSAGWMAKNSVSNFAPTGDMISDLSKTWSSKSASKSGIAAAIKGLKGKSNEAVAGDIDSLLSLLNYGITGFELYQFNRETAESNSSNKDLLEVDDLGLDIPEYDPELSEQQIGFGIASRLVMNGIVENKELKKYVNLITQALVANSFFYDWEFNTIILDSENHDGFACPGGFIFITSGAIKSCSDEAELASIIAHEISHVIRKHGLQEMTKRESHIKMDKAFNELDAETGDKDEVVEELEKIMMSSYDRIVHERLFKYEIEADQVASVLCANAGYDPFGIVRVTRRFSGLYEKSEDIFDEDYLSPDDMTGRANAISEFTEEEFERENAGARNRERFNEYASILNK